MHKVLFALNNTSQSFARCEIVCRLVFRILTASSGRSTMMYRLVPFAKRRIEPPIRFTMSLMYIRKRRGPSKGPCGTPARNRHT